MATVESATRPNDRHNRRRPFAWMKRLANLKSSSPQRAEKKLQSTGHSKSKSQQHPAKNNPYPESGHLHRPAPARDAVSGRTSFSTRQSATASSYGSFDESSGAANGPMKSNRSAAPTFATNPETIHSKAGTSNTVGGGMSSRDGERNSTFSSPNHSDRSLTTTLTTIHSTAPSGLLNPPTNIPITPAASPNAASTQTNNHSFNQPYPISPPASAVPPHIQQQLHPHTYSAATANNILTDDASILTLASSSHRRRRRSLDTNASVRALAPSSLFGASRESLPLSVLSATTGPQEAPRPSVGGLASAERASVYSSSGVGAPAAMGSERNSYYADKTKSISSAAGVGGGLRDVSGGAGGETGSVVSGMVGHGKTESISGVSVSSPLASPKEASGTGRLSRKGSGWTKGDVEEEEESDDIYDDGSDVEMEEGGTRRGLESRGSVRSSKRNADGVVNAI